MRWFFRSIFVMAALSCGKSELAADAGLLTLDVTDASVMPDAATEDPRGKADCSHITILGLKASRSTLSPGEPVELSWTGAMARGCDVSPMGGAYSGGFVKVTVKPTVTTEYTIGCYGTACWDTPSSWAVAKVTVTVR